MFDWNKNVKITVKFSEIEGLLAFDNDFEGLKDLHSGVPVITKNEDGSNRIVADIPKRKIHELNKRIKRFNELVEVFKRPNWKARIMG